MNSKVYQTSWKQLGDTRITAMAWQFELLQTPATHALQTTVDDVPLAHNG